MYALVLTRDINVMPLAAWFNEDITNAKRLRRNAEIRGELQDYLLILLPLGRNEIVW